MTTFAFFVLVEYVDSSGGLQSADVGYSNDVDPEDFFMAIEDKDWTRLEWYTTDTTELVHTYDHPIGCNHPNETLIDESPSGCEYECNDCGFLRFEPHKGMEDL